VVSDPLFYASSAGASAVGWEGARTHGTRKFVRPIVFDWLEQRGAVNFKMKKNSKPAFRADVPLTICTKHPLSAARSWQDYSGDREVLDDYVRPHPNSNSGRFFTQTADGHSELIAALSPFPRPRSCCFVLLRRGDT